MVRQSHEVHAEDGTRLTARAVIRLFQPADDAAIRRICFDTALYGESMAPLLDDPALIAEALLGDYTRFEPEGLWVAEDAGRVVGYLSACADTRRSERLYALHIAPRLALRFLVRGHWLRPRLWRFGVCSGVHARNVHRARQTVLASHPAHLHINIEKESRGNGVGRALLERSLTSFYNQSVKGVHIFAASQGGRAFFARAGFEVLAKTHGCSVTDGSNVETWLMGKLLKGVKP